MLRSFAGTRRTTSDTAAQRATSDLRPCSCVGTNEPLHDPAHAWPGVRRERNKVQQASL